LSLKRYSPAMVSFDLGSVLRELRNISELSNEADPHAHFQVLHGAPKRTFSGMVVYADGADYKIGSGPGLYRRDEANTKWEPASAQNYARYFMLMGG
jgi:hypothetical protein